MEKMDILLNKIESEILSSESDLKQNGRLGLLVDSVLVNVLVNHYNKSEEEAIALADDVVYNISRDWMPGLSTNELMAIASEHCQPLILKLNETSPK